MEQQPGLFDDADRAAAELDVDPRENVRTTDPDTSWQAAYASAFGENYRIGQRVNIYRAIIAAGPDGATDEENALTFHPPMRLSSADKRRGELMKCGLVCDSGRRRKTTSGCQAIVWIAVEFCDRPGPHGRHADDLSADDDDQDGDG
jgi:hypothetical protein